MVIGLTGSIASGKSTVSNYLKRRNFLVYDADEIAKEIVNNQDVIEEIKSIFGTVVFDSNNNLDRRKMKKIVFNDEDKRKILNAIIHPRVYKYFQDVREKKSENLIFFDVPLLYESGIEKLCDKVILIVADDEKKIERIIKRDNLDVELAKKIIFSQMPDTEKKKKADIIIENNGSIEELLEQLERLCDFLWK